MVHLSDFMENIKVTKMFDFKKLKTTKTKKLKKIETYKFLGKYQLNTN